MFFDNITLLNTLKRITVIIFNNKNIVLLLHLRESMYLQTFISF